MIKLYLSIAFLFSCYGSFSQKKWLFGYLQDSVTHYVIPYASVINGTTNKSVLTDDKGFFKVEVSPHDVLYARARNFYHDTLVYSMLFNDTITLFLVPLGNILPDVTVTSRYTKYQLDSMRRRNEFEQNRGQRLPSVSRSNSSGFGIGLNLDRLFKSKYRYMRKNEKRFPEREKMAYIEYRFSSYVVAHYTGLKGDTLRDFILHNAPSYKWLREHPSSEDVMYYINDRLKAYRKTQ